MRLPHGVAASLPPVRLVRKGRSRGALEAVAMSARVLPMAPCVRKRLRQDVLRWARMLHYSPEPCGDPDAILDFLDACLERFPEEYTDQHVKEIFAWHREALGPLPGPEAA